MTLLRSFVVALSLTLAAHTRACEPLHIDTPKQLVQHAEGIYLATAVDYVPGTYTPKSFIVTASQAKVRFTVNGVLKGSKIDSVEVVGELNQVDDPNDHSVPYDFVRPGGRHGNCHAYTYKKGQEYLLFLRAGAPYWSPLAPTNEQITGSRDPWVLWVEKHLGRSKAA